MCEYTKNTCIRTHNSLHNTLCMHVYGNLDNICMTVAYVVLYIMHVLPYTLYIEFLDICVYLFFVHASIVYIIPTLTHAFLSLCGLMLPNKNC